MHQAGQILICKINIYQNQLYVQSPYFTKSKTQLIIKVVNCTCVSAPGCQTNSPGMSVHLYVPMRAWSKGEMNNVVSNVK